MYAIRSYYAYVPFGGLAACEVNIRDHAVEVVGKTVVADRRTDGWYRRRQDDGDDAQGDRDFRDVESPFATPFHVSLYAYAWKVCC